MAAGHAEGEVTMADDADRATAAVEFADTHALRRHRSAAAAAEPGDGICRACNEAIEPDRLAAVPHAQHCRECARDAEAEGRRRKIMGRE